MKKILKKTYPTRMSSTKSYSTKLIDPATTSTPITAENYIGYDGMDISPPRVHGNRSPTSIGVRLWSITTARTVHLPLIWTTRSTVSFALPSPDFLPAKKFMASHNALMCVVSLPLTLNSVVLFCTFLFRISGFSGVSIYRARHSWLIRNKPHLLFGGPITSTSGILYTTAGPFHPSLRKLSFVPKEPLRNSRSFTMEAPISDATRSSSLTAGTLTALSFILRSVVNSVSAPLEAHPRWRVFCPFFIVLGLRPVSIPIGGRSPTV